MMLGMEPGVQTGPNKSGQTRFNNDRVRAARSSFVNNLAAQDSLHTENNSNVRSYNPPVGQPSMRPTSGSQPSQMPIQQFQGQTGQPQMPQQPQEISPETELTSILNSLKLERFLTSLPVQQAVSKTRLQEYFQRNNPNKDIRPLADKVLDNLTSFG